MSMENLIDITNRVDKSEYELLAGHEDKGKSRVKKKSWTTEEDQKLYELVISESSVSWVNIAKSLTDRTGKQCRERWYNKLDPNIKRGNWTDQEDLLITQLHALHGNKWAEISKELNGRPGNMIKNRWNSYLSKRCIEEISDNLGQQQNKRRNTERQEETNLEDQESSLFQQQKVTSPIKLSSRPMFCTFKGNMGKAQLTHLPKDPVDWTKYINNKNTEITDIEKGIDYSSTYSSESTSNSSSPQYKSTTSSSGSSPFSTPLSYNTSIETASVPSRSSKSLFTQTYTPPHGQYTFPVFCVTPSNSSSSINTFATPTEFTDKQPSLQTSNFNIFETSAVNWDTPRHVKQESELPWSPTEVNTLYGIQCPNGASILEKGPTEGQELKQHSTAEQSSLPLEDDDSSESSWYSPSRSSSPPSSLPSSPTSSLSGSTDQTSPKPVYEPLLLKSPFLHPLNEQEVASNLERLRTRINISTKPKGHVKPLPSERISLTLYPSLVKEATCTIPDPLNTEVSTVTQENINVGYSSHLVNESKDNKVEATTEAPELITFSGDPPLSSTPTFQRSRSHLHIDETTYPNPSSECKSASLFSATLTLTPSKTPKISKKLSEKSSLTCDEALPDNDAELLLFADPFSPFFDPWNCQTDNGTGNDW